MKITFDLAKRAATLAQRGLDFEDAADVFAGPMRNKEDHRKDYGETRIQTIGYLAGRMVMVVWTARGEARHIISMRYCHDKEKKRWRKETRMD